MFKCRLKSWGRASTYVASWWYRPYFPPGSEAPVLSKWWFYISGNALALVQGVHEHADLWDITFCTR